MIGFWCDPGCGAPRHHHFEVEELITVVEGLADFEVDGERRPGRGGGHDLAAGVEPPWVPECGPGHSFGSSPVFPVAAPPVEYEEEPGVILEIAGIGGRRRDAHRAVR